MTGSDPDSSVGTPVLKRDAILDHLRTLIVAGEVKPGRRMPARSKIKNQFKTGRRSVDQAFEQLEQDGFVHSEPSHGTYVSEHPPHLCHYAVVLAGEERDSAFPAALDREAAAMRKELSGRILTYANVVPDSTDYHRLLGDMKAHRVAGLIFQQNPENLGLAGTPVLTMPGIPRVALEKVPGIAAVLVDPQAFADKAMLWLARRGRRRLACLVHCSGWSNDMLSFWEDAAQKNSLLLPCGRCHFLVAQTARSLVQLLMSLPEAERPHAMIVQDDNLIEQASLGLFDSGVRVGEEIDVVGHCNFSRVIPSHVPMKRLGWDDRELLRACMAQIDRMRAGEQMPPPIVVEPLFDHEMEERKRQETGKGGRSEKEY